MEEIDKECKHCGRPFVTHIKRKVYCSVSCRSSAESRRNRKRRKNKKVLEVKHTPIVVLEKVDLSFYY